MSRFQKILVGGVWSVVWLLMLAMASATWADSPLRNPVASDSGVDADGTAFVVESVPGTAATATGTDAIAIGDGAVGGNAAGDAGTIAIGQGASAIGAGSSIAIGQNAEASGANGSIAIGGSVAGASAARAAAAGAIAIGPGSDTTTSDGVAIGTTAQVIAALGIAIGRNTDVSGANCIAIGGNATDGDSADCSAADSVAIGQHILADDIGQVIFGSGEFAAQSDASRSFYVLRNTTTDATQTELFADGSAADISVPSDCTIVFDLLLVARQTDADDVEAGYKLEGVIGNNAGTTALVGTIGKTVLAEDVAGWDVTATADDANDGLNVLVTGAVGDAVQWVASVNTVKTCG